MLKQLLDSGKTAFSVYKRLVQTEENNKKLEERANHQDEKIEHLSDALKDALYELKLTRQVVESGSQIAARDQRILVLQLEAALKDRDTRALPPGSALPQSEMAELRAKIEAIEKRLEALENANA